MRGTPPRRPKIKMLGFGRRELWDKYVMTALNPTYPSPILAKWGRGRPLENAQALKGGYW